MRTSSYGKNKKPEKQKPQGVKKVSDMKWLRFIRKLKPYNIQKGLRYLKHYGPKEFLIRLSERMEPEEVPVLIEGVLACYDRLAKGGKTA